MFKNMKFIILYLFLAISLIFLCILIFFNENNKLEWNDSYIINIPIDSRPISRNNFKDLVDVSGMKYLEIGSKFLDNFNNNKYYPGKSKSIFKELNKKIKNYNDNNNYVILNLSSLFYGGLIAENISHDNNVIKYNLQNLKNIIKDNNRINYFIVINSPKILTNNYMYQFGNDDNVLNKKINGLLYFYNKYNNSNFSCNEYYLKGLTDANCQNTITTSLMEYEYINSLKLNNDKIPIYMNEFYNWFKNNYNEYIISYESIFNTYYKYTNTILNNFNNYKNITIVLGANDFEVSDSINFLFQNNLLNEYKFMDKKKHIIKYSILYNIFNNISIKYDDLNIFGCDEINHLILSRIVLKQYNKIKNSDYYINFKLLNELKNNYGQYEKFSNRKYLNNSIKFVNGNYNTEQLDSKLYFLNPKYDSKEDELNILIKNSNLDIKKINIIDVSNSNNQLNLEEINKVYDLSNNKDNLFNFQSITSWNTISNSIGIGISKATIFSIFDNDFKYIEDVDIKSPNYFRLKALITVKIKSIIEDSFYNNYRNKDIDLKLVEKNSINFIKNLNSIKINKFMINIKNYNLEISKPWNRNFDTLVKFDLEFDYNKEK